MPADIAAPHPATPSGPAALYRERCAAGAISSDPVQAKAVARLDELHRALASHAPAARGWLARLGLAGGAEPPKGLYIWGPVGRGKSMLMDLFFAAAPVAKKRRVHFHAFMLEVHDRMEVERRRKSRQPIARVAAQLAAEAANWERVSGVIGRLLQLATRR